MSRKPQPLRVSSGIGLGTARWPPPAFARAGMQWPDHASAAAAAATLLAGKAAAAVTGGGDSHRHLHRHESVFVSPGEFRVGGWSGLNIGPRFPSSPATTTHRALTRSPTEARGNRRKGEERSRGSRLAERGHPCHGHVSGSGFPPFSPPRLHSKALPGPPVGLSLTGETVI